MDVCTKMSCLDPRLVTMRGMEEFAQVLHFLTVFRTAIHLPPFTRAVSRYRAWWCSAYCRLAERYLPN